MRDSAEASGVQLGKILAPALRAETLERPRLLDWLSAKIHGRVITVIADAGYGKTTLLADFARRTRLRTMWYRLDETDRDWTSFLRHLVAAGREHVPDFAPRSLALLGEVGMGGPTRESVLETFIRELAEISDEGGVIIFDDFHLVDDAKDPREIAHRLIQEAPERLTFVFASRRQPTIPLSRLRAAGDLAELATDDLRFDVAETTRLFNETYGRNVESDVLVDLARRTEGWVASLQLVQTALRNRTPSEIRRFVRDLSGAEAGLYDYLAEEVVGELPDDLQHFLNTTSILQVVTPELASVVSDLAPGEVTRLMQEAERLTLISAVSGSPRTHKRYHPLVREFLETRLESIHGSAFVAERHRAVAERVADWRVAAHHLRAAGDDQQVVKAVREAIPAIMANAQYAIAESYLPAQPDETAMTPALLVKGRLALQRGDYEGAAAAASSVLADADASAAERDHALLNIIAVCINQGDGAGANIHAKTLRDSTSDSDLRAIAEATLSLISLKTEGDLERFNSQLRRMASAQRQERPHHYGVTMHNLSLNSLAQDRLTDASREAEESLQAMGRTSAAVERQAAAAVKVAVLLRLGAATEGSEIARDLMTEEPPLQNDTLIELADAFLTFGNVALGRSLLQRMTGPDRRTIVDRQLLAVVSAREAVRDGDGPAAMSLLEDFDGDSTAVGLEANRAVVAAHAALIQGTPDARVRLAAARRLAATQGMHGPRRTAELLEAVASGPDAASDAIEAIAPDFPWHLAAVAEAVLPLVANLRPSAQDFVAANATHFPERWRRTIRASLARGDCPIEAARLLERIGETPDILRLRSAAKRYPKSMRAAGLGRELARRLADRVYVEDLGRLLIRVGEEQVPGTAVRRKVLALLCYLLSKPGSSATRDQVLDAMWPALEPDVAVNSLNQTLYFLRRVFEPNYVEDTSPGYVNHDSDVVWLDPELVTSRSQQVRHLLRELSTPATPAEVETVAFTYSGRFALDFEYEDWAVGPRETLHASYLEVVERAVYEDLSSGHLDRAIRIARRALEVDPEADAIEVALLRLYRDAGAHAAAAEQYGHYAEVMRVDLGVTPPALEDV